jgi:hypothetical protein
MDFGAGSGRVKKIGHNANLHSRGTSLSFTYGVTVPYIPRLSTNLRVDKTWMIKQTSDITNLSWNIRIEPLSFISFEGGLHAGYGWVRTLEDDYKEGLTGYRLAGQLFLGSGVMDPRWGLELSYMRDRAAVKRWAGDENSLNNNWFHMWQIQLFVGLPKIETSDLFSGEYKTAQSSTN